MINSKIKVALITGGASGMGRLMATRLANEGVKVAIVDVNEQMMLETAKESDNISTYVCDISDWQAAANVVEKIERELGSIDRVATAAAIMPAQELIDMDVSLIGKCMRVNYEGTINIVKAVIPGMVERKFGQVILFGSIAGIVPSKRFAAYGATKAAINLWGEVLTEELKGTGVHVLTVRPAAVNTPLIDQATGKGGLDALRKQVESGRMASASTIIDAIEKGMLKKKRVVYPTMEAHSANFLRRLSPALAWFVINRVNG